MRVDSRAEGEGPRRVAEGKAFMPRAAQWDSRVRSTGTMLGVRLLVLVLVARHGPLVVLRRRPTQAETPKTVRGHVFKGHFEPDRLYGAIEVVGKRYVAEYCPKPDSWNRRFRHPWSGYCWGAEIFISAYRRKRSGVHYCRGEQHGRSPTEIRHATQLVYVPIGALTCPGPVAPDGVTSPSELAGDVVAANLSRWLSTIRRTKVSDTSTRPL